MPKRKDRNSHAASAVVSQRISCGYTVTDSVPIVKSTSSLAVVVRLVSDRSFIMKALLTSVFVMLAFQANADDSVIVGSEREVKCSVVKESMELHLYLSTLQLKMAQGYIAKKGNVDFLSLANENRKVAADWATIYTAKCK
jgi:hypothetical protein